MDMNSTDQETLGFAAAFGRFAGATFDSRQVAPGMLYVALAGEHADGHDFVASAFAAGAACALVRADWPCPAEVDESRLLRVADTRRAFGDLARAYRNTLKAKVVGITGSAGKTTVKELTAAFLRAGGHRVHATAGNYNNDLGLPLTVLNCPPDADFLVVEMGTNHPGEIARLVEIAAPDIGLVSSIGTAHIEFFQTQDGIAAEKGTLLARLPPDGFAVLARENERYAALAGMSAAPLETVSLADAAAAPLADALKVRLPGQHNVLNALIAFGCARRLGVGLDACVAALKDFSLPGGRWRVSQRDGVTFIDDTYNANPTSMVAALESFAALPCEGRRIAVLGDMFELGDRSAEYHAEVGRCARARAIDSLVTVGPQANANMGGDRSCASVEEAREVLATLLQPGDLVLLKASHGMHLEKIMA